MRLGDFRCLTASAMSVHRQACSEDLRPPDPSSSTEVQGLGCGG